MDREAKDKAINTGYYKGMDLDAESYVPLSFEKVEDGYVLKFKDKDEIFEVPVSSGLLSRVLRGLRAHRLEEIEKSESLQPASLQRSA
jgi:hypothetical protein